MFFQKSPPILIEQLAKIIGAETNVSGITVSDVGPLDNLDKGILGCYHNTKYKTSLAQAKSGFCILK